MPTKFYQSDVMFVDINIFPDIAKLVLAKLCDEELAVSCVQLPKVS